MRWYVRRSGETIGPLADAEVTALVRDGMSEAQVVPVGSEEWSELKDSPFASAIGGKSSQGGEGIGYAILLVPFATTLLVWFWVGSMSLLERPDRSLVALTCSTVGLTAILMATEASQLGMGKKKFGKKGKPGTGPVAYFIAACLFWIGAFPYYLWDRSRYGRKNLAIGGTFIALVFVGSAVVMGTAIEQKRAEIRRSFENLQQTFNPSALPDP